MARHDFAAAREQHAALLRVAQPQRLVRLASPHQSRRFRRLLDQLGILLIAWGWRLRARSGQLEPVAAVELLDVRWPGLLFSSPLLARAGVATWVGAAHLRADCAQPSLLYASCQRRYRPEEVTAVSRAQRSTVLDPKHLARAHEHRPGMIEPRGAATTSGQ